MRRLSLGLLSLLLWCPSVGAVASQDFNGTTSTEVCGAVPIGTTLTWAAWVKCDSDGENNLGRIFEKGDGSPLIANLVTKSSDTTPELRFVYGWSTTDGNWDTGGATLTCGVWQHVAVTYDAGSVLNDPIFYINGTAVAATEDATPTLTVETDENVLRIGNNSATNTTFDGRIAHAAQWNRILALWEIQEIMRHPTALPSGMVFYRSLMDASGDDLSGGGFDCTPANVGTSADGPPIYLMSPLALWLRLWESIDHWLTPLAWADDVVICDPDHPIVPGAVSHRYLTTTSVPYQGNSNAKIWTAPNTSHTSQQVTDLNTLRAAIDDLAPVPLKHWKCSGNVPVEMSAGEKSSVDAEEASQAAAAAAQAYATAVQEGRVPVGAILLLLSGTCPANYTEVSALNGKTLLGTLAANSNVGTTGGADNITPAGTNSGAAVTDHASHTHTYAQMLNHTHPVTDPGHQHGMNEGTTDGSGIFQDRSNAGAATTAVTDVATTGVTTANPAGGVATGTTAGPSAPLSHSVTQPTFTGTAFDNRSAFARVIFCQKQ